MPPTIRWLWLHSLLHCPMLVAISVGIFSLISVKGPSTSHVAAFVSLVVDVAAVVVVVAGGTVE